MSAASTSGDLRLVCLDPLPPGDHTYGEHREALSKYFDSHTVAKRRIVFAAPATREEDEAKRLALQADLWLITDAPATGALIRQTPRLGFIQKLGVLIDQVDVAAATARGIPVAVTPHFGCVAVAEHALMLMLALGKDLVRLHARTVSADNPRGLEPVYTTQHRRYFNYLGLPEDHFTQLYGKTLGIVGLGEIGLEVARRARAFGMRVLYLKRQRLSPQQETAFGVQFVDLPTLLAQSDFVSIHAIHTPETERMIGARELAMMRPSAFLINTARGNIVDEQALVESLRGGQIAGAGLDVFSVEPPQPDNPLLRLPNVILSPHVAARGPVIARYTRFFDNLTAFLEGRRPEDVVNPEVFG